jgi:streptogramin lyase
LCFATVTGARAERLPIRAYTTADGLADERIKCIVSDSRGFLWFCGPDGLSRFDGRGFTTYRVPEGVSPTSINDFLETSRGVYWIATNGGGVYRFNPLMKGPPRQRRIVTIRSRTRMPLASRRSASVTTRRRTASTCCSKIAPDGCGRARTADCFLSKSGLNRRRSSAFP